MAVHAEAILVEAAEVAGAGAVVVDCRFDLARPAAGREAFLAGHIPGAHYLDLDRDLSAPRGEHGGRHPLPPPAIFAATLARCGIGLDTPVIVYDASCFAFAGRLWWMMRALGYRPPALLNGGYDDWLAAGGQPETGEVAATPCAVPAVGDYAGRLAIDDVCAAQAAGATLVDARAADRYRGENETMDPVAGHIPGAENRFWGAVTDDGGRLLDDAALAAHWGDLLEAERLVGYCGSGVSTCINLFTLARLGRSDAQLYAGSWSDWCSYL
ncbi:sulfurtransferase [Pseudohaliea rubra]|uniref:Thiosulfate sulfurtransferase, rhodanese n=1 Tax=Pseudohaliea rubra DSM 19751 TaxID=1265313 RepID=A0A095VV57_9GAMM|nr:sulfurtransferase [Pseudohaliea rubra]KGE05352.1 Thiosulfate sulfurtransferase, rhodanese [Pseudohaliea rubra DSM 19751]